MTAKTIGYPIYKRFGVGRPKGTIRLTAEQIIAKYPNISPKQLARHLNIKRNYAKQLRHRINKHNNNNKTVTNRHNQHNNIINRQNKHSQLYSNDIHDIILMYILRKEAQNKRYFNCLRSVFGNGYTIQHLGTPLWRYDNDMILEVKDGNYRLREPIQQLKDKHTFIMKNHRHQHNNKHQIIAFHIGSHDLTKYLCNDNYLGIDYKARIYLGKNHFISTDASGLDICHKECFINLLETNLKTGRIGTRLLESTFLHGKYVVGNEVKFEW